jgi:hypothetical protein
MAGRPEVQMRNAHQVLAPLDARNKKKILYSGIKWLLIAAIMVGGVVVAMIVREGFATAGSVAISRPEPALSPVVTVLYEHDLWTLRVSSAGPIDAEVVGEGTIVDGVRYVPIKREGSSLVWNLVVLGTNTFTVGQKIQVHSHYHTGGVPGPGSVIYILAQ